MFNLEHLNKHSLVRQERVKAILGTSDIINSTKSNKINTNDHNHHIKETEELRNKYELLLNEYNKIKDLKRGCDEIWSPQQNDIDSPFGHELNSTSIWSQNKEIHRELLELRNSVQIEEYNKMGNRTQVQIERIIAKQKQIEDTVESINNSHHRLLKELREKDDDYLSLKRRSHEQIDLISKDATSKIEILCDRLRKLDEKYLRTFKTLVNRTLELENNIKQKNMVSFSSKFSGNYEKKIKEESIINQKYDELMIENERLKCELNIKCEDLCKQNYYVIELEAKLMLYQDPKCSITTTDSFTDSEDGNSADWNELNEHKQCDENQASQVWRN